MRKYSKAMLLVAVLEDKDLSMIEIIGAALLEARRRHLPIWAAILNAALKKITKRNQIFDKCEKEKNKYNGPSMIFTHGNF